MNKANILSLAALIESLPASQFGMVECIVGCGTPSCIAGWAAWEEQGRPMELYDNRESWTDGKNNLITSALRHFGIEEEREKYRVASELFRGDYSYRENVKLSKDDAVQALRHFAETGKIVWPEK